MKLPKGEYHYTVVQNDIDFNGRATTVSTMNYILQAAGDDADLKGFGVKNLNYANSSWVLSRLAVEFSRRLVQGDSIMVETWVNEVNRMITTRNMVVTDQNGRAVASAVTQWAVIDIDKRRAIDIRESIDYQAAVIEEPSPITHPQRVAKVESGSRNEHRVVYSDLDFNRHVNAMKYIELMFDILPLEQMESSVLRRMDINFLHEARYGDTLFVWLERDGEQVRFEIENQDKITICRVAMELVAR